MCDGRFPVSSPGGVSAARLPQSPEASAASSDLTAVAVSAEPGSAPASDPVSGILGASGPTGFPSGVSPFKGPLGTRPASFGFGPFGPPPPVADDHVNTPESNPQHLFFAEPTKSVKNDEKQSESARFDPRGTPSRRQRHPQRHPRHLHCSPVGTSVAFNAPPSTRRGGPNAAGTGRSGVLCGIPG